MKVFTALLAKISVKMLIYYPKQEKKFQLKVNIQSTQCGFYVFHFTTADKFYLARPLSPPQDRQQGAVAVVAVADYRMVAYI